MKYVLRREVLASTAEKQISEARFQEISEARQNLFELLAIEEKYDLLVRNYLGFEQVVYDSSITGLLYTERSWSDFIEHIQAANLAVMNLLAMCRSYVDHAPQHLSTIFPDLPEKKDAFHNERKTVYSEFLGYRALYEIRNHVQHCGLPVHSFTLGGSWLDTREACRHNAIPCVSVEELAKDNSFSKKILQELQGMGERIDLRLLIRENMSASGRIHKCVRKLTKDLADDSERIVSDCLEDFSEHYDSDLIGLSIMKLDTQGQVIDKYSLFDDMVKRRKYLEQKNKTLVNVEKHFVTGQIET